MQSSAPIPDCFVKVQAVFANQDWLPSDRECYGFVAQFSLFGLGASHDWHPSFGSTSTNTVGKLFVIPTVMEHS